MNISSSAGSSSLNLSGGNKLPTPASSEASAQFASLLTQAKARLENPLGSVSGIGAAGGNASDQNGSIDLSGGISSASNDSFDAFSGVDAMNERVFSAIRSTIEDKLNQLKTQQAARESKVSTTLPEQDVTQLFLMASKVGELYASSESVSYKKTAEKTLTKIILKLSVEAEKGSVVAKEKLQQLVGKIPEGTAPSMLLNSVVEAMMPVADTETALTV